MSTTGESTAKSPAEISCEGATAPASHSPQKLQEKLQDVGEENHTDPAPDKAYLYEITCIHNTKQIIKKHINNIKNTHNITNPLNPNLFIKRLIEALRASARSRA